MKLAVIPGDGIGPEVTAEALKVLDAVQPAVECTMYDLGATRYLASGELLPRNVLDELRMHDAILLGAIGHPDVAPGILERGLLLELRFALDHHVNLRPGITAPDVVGPLAGNPPMDLLVIREGTEGLYTGTGGAIRVGTPHEIAIETSTNTAYGIERVVQFAFRAAVNRRQHLTLVHKTNVLTFAGSLWQRVVDQVGLEFPSVTVSYQHVDATTVHLVNNPGAFDVIVTDNLFGDIITDLVAAISGGIGLAASGNIDSSGTNPPMFEPVHGSAPDIAGQFVADPVAAVKSVALMLDHLGHRKSAAKVENAVRDELRGRTPGLRSGTRDVGDRLASAAGRSGDLT